MLTLRPPGRSGSLLLSALLAPALVLSGAATGSTASTIPTASTASPATLGYAAIEGFWIAAGGPSNLASTAAAIAAAESRFEPDVIQSGQPYAKTGWGLWQITPGDSAPTSFGSDYQLLDPWNNAEAAVWKYDQQGLNAWSTYYDGTYKSYVQNVSPDTSVTDPGEYAPVNAAPSDTPSSPDSEPGSTYGPGMPGNAGSVFEPSRRRRHQRAHNRPRYAATMADDTWAGLADQFADGAYATAKGRVRTYVVWDLAFRRLARPERISTRSQRHAAAGRRGRSGTRSRPPRPLPPAEPNLPPGRT